MAFDLWLEKQCESIEEYEEGLFEFIGNESEFPALNYLWREFYGSPKFDPEMSNSLVHELIAIQEVIKNQKEHAHLRMLIERLLPLFSKAYKKSKTIQGAGD